MSLAEFFTSEMFRYLCYGAVAVSVLLGVLALLSPTTFAGVCKSCRHWVNTPARLRKLDDYVVDTDALAVEHSRFTGFLFLLLAVVLAFCSGLV